MNLNPSASRGGMVHWLASRPHSVEVQDKIPALAMCSLHVLPRARVGFLSLLPNRKAVRVTIADAQSAFIDLNPVRTILHSFQEIGIENCISFIVFI